MTVQPVRSAAQPSSAQPSASVAPRFAEALAQVDRVILGKQGAVRLCVCCLLAGGHLLIEDVPGVGKTTLVHALVATLGLGFGRVQFTSDLLPADLLGVSVFERELGSFRFHPGPIFTEVLLADELNRATPRTQSALLEAMEERQVSVDGETRALPDPFFVIATQNPQGNHGTYPLPEAQLDRFLLSVTLGYPDPQAERELLLSGGRRRAAGALPAQLRAGDLEAARQEVEAVHVSGALIDYVQLLLRATRDAAQVGAGVSSLGLSPRAGLGLVAAARAWAWLSGRSSVWPDDVRAVFPALATHRLTRQGDGLQQPDVVARLLREVPVP